MYDEYFTGRLLGTLQLLDEAVDPRVRAAHEEVCRHYRNILAPPATRKAERSRVSIAATIALKTPRLEATVLDLSTAGFKIRSSMEAPPGSIVLVKFPKMEAIEARVVWVTGEEAGCEFLEPLPPPLLDVILRMSEVFPAPFGEE